MNHTAIYHALLTYLAQYGVRVRLKHSSLLMKVIAKILFFVPDFSTRFTTTIGRTIYVPSVDVEDWPTLAHEAIHVIDYKRRPVRFLLGYLFPQVLALGALGTIGAVWCPYAWVCLVFLLALAPWPAPFRVSSERRGYLMSICCWLIQYKDLGLSNIIDVQQEYYTGSSYYWMDENEQRVRQRIAADFARAKALVNGTEEDPDYSPILQVILVNSGA